MGLERTDKMSLVEVYMLLGVVMVDNLVVVVKMDKVSLVLS